MNRLLLTLTLSVFFPIFICKADITVLNETPNSYISPSIVKTQDVKNVQNPDFVEAPAKLIKRHAQRIGSEYWNIEDKKSNTLASRNRHTYRTYDGFLSAVSPDYTVKRGFLTLSKVSADRNKQSFMFVFFMNEDKSDSKKLRDSSVDNPRNRMHVLWPGSKKIHLEQKEIKN